MRSLVFLIALLMALPSLAEMYRWKDAQGNVVFGDSPPEGVQAEPVRVRPNVVETPSLPQAAPPSPAAEPAAPAYRELRIVDPVDGSTVRENAGNIVVSISLDPGLNVRAGHKVQLLLDGNQVAEGQTVQFPLTNVDRGTHSLSVRVVTAQGRELASSPAISFTLQRYSALQGPGPHLPGAGTPRTAPRTP